MSDNSNYIKNSLLILHGYFAVLLIILTTFLVFKFYDYRPGKTPEVRPHIIKLVNEDYAAYSNMEFDGNVPLAVARDGKERMAFMLSAIFVSSVIFLSLFFFRKNPVFLRQKNWKYVYKYLSAFTTYLILTASFGIISSQKLEIYFSFFALCSALLMAYAIVIYGRYNPQKLQGIFIVLAVSLAAFVASYTILNEQNLAEYSTNFDVIAYPLVQQFLGKAVLIDLKSNYGLFPYFLEPVLHFSGISVEAISIVLAALVLICLLAILFCFFVVIKNKLLAFTGFCALVFFQNFSTDIWPQPFGISYQYEPIRLFFPALLLAFFCYYFKKPTPKKYYFSLFFFALAPLWNLDSGLPAFLLLVMILGYEKWFFSARERFAVKAIILHLVQCLGILSVVWGLFFLMIKLRYGIWPDIALLTYGQKAAFDFGFSMLEMPLFGIWQILLLIYLAGLIVAISDFFDKNYSLQSVFLLISTLLGIGLFTYYLGRSHDTNIPHCAYPAIIVLTIFAERFCAKFHGFKADMILRIMPLFFICYLFVALFCSLISDEKLRENFFLNRKADETFWLKELSFIEKYVGKPENPRDDLLLIEMNNMNYFFTAKLLIRSPLDMVNMYHLFYVHELEEIYRMISAGEKKWVVMTGPEDFPQLDKEELKEMNSLLRGRYKIVGEFQGVTGNKAVIYRLGD